MSVIDKFLIADKVVLITGGAGLLGRQYAGTVIEAGGIPVLLDINLDALKLTKKQLDEKYNKQTAEIYQTNITNKIELEKVRDEIILKHGHIDILINNAANNPKMESKTQNMSNSKFEFFSEEIWDADFSVGLKGAFFCTQIFGAHMAKQGGGVILNISSDLGIIAPDQRIYYKEGLSEEEQTVKPITYSVLKHGILGLTKYIATYWADKGVRCNALCPGGVYNGQDKAFIDKLTKLIPIGRMADISEYNGTILYMISDASSYMNGSTVIVDGGRTCW